MIYAFLFGKVVKVWFIYNVHFCPLFAGGTGTGTGGTMTGGTGTGTGGIIPGGLIPGGTGEISIKLVYYRLFIWKIMYTLFNWQYLELIQVL